MNKYDIVSKVGEGAYGVVLKCKHKETGEIVAIKKFKEGQDDELVRKTTMREVAILAMVRSENIVLLKDAFRRKGKLYLVFEYMEQNLLEVLEANPNGLPPDLVKLYIYQLVKAIHWCHTNEIIHRDIKPENLLVNQQPDQILKLCDFGFARKIGAAGNSAASSATNPSSSSASNNSSSSSASQSSQPDALMTDYVATRWYRAPELLLGSTSYDTAVDVWSIACIMGELIDGQPLFPGETELDQLYLIQKMLGSITSNQQEMYNKNPRYVGTKLPFSSSYKPSSSNTLEKRYLGKLSKRALSFMKGILKMEESERMTAAECLEHPYFESLRKLEARAADATGSAAGSKEKQSPNAILAAAPPIVIPARKSSKEEENGISNTIPTPIINSTSTSTSNSRSTAATASSQQPIDNTSITATRSKLASRGGQRTHSPKYRDDAGNNVNSSEMKDDAPLSSQHRPPTRGTNEVGASTPSGAAARSRSPQGHGTTSLIVEPRESREKIANYKKKVKEVREYKDTNDSNSTVVQQATRLSTYAPRVAETEDWQRGLYSTPFQSPPQSQQSQQQQQQQQLFQSSIMSQLPAPVVPLPSVSSSYPRVPNTKILPMIGNAPMPPPLMNGDATPNDLYRSSPTAASGFSGASISRKENSTHHHQAASHKPQKTSSSSSSSHASSSHTSQSQKRDPQSHSHKRDSGHRSSFQVAPSSSSSSSSSQQQSSPYQLSSSSNSSNPYSQQQLQQRPTSMAGTRVGSSGRHR